MKDDEWSLAAVILRIAKATKRAQFKFRPGCFISHRESYEVGPDALEDYKQLPWRLLKFSGAYRWFSVTAVGIMVNQSLARLVDEQAAAEAASSELHSVLQTLSATPPEQTVLRALTGIKFPTRTRPLALAGLKIAPFTNRDRRRLMTQYRAYARSAISNPQGRRRYVAAMATDLDQWKEKTVMWSTHAAESTRAEELSLETAHQVCALFRYACMSLRTDSVEMAIGLGSVQSTDYLIIPKEGSIMSGGGSAGKNRSWTITYSERAAMHKAGVFVLSDLYKESNGDKAPPSTSFHAALLRALHWVDLSVDQLDNGSRMLALTVSLETLFSPRASKVSSAIADGTAVTISQTLADRKRISKRMRQLYKKRCDIAHGRGPDGLLDSDLREMENIVRLVIGTLCHHLTEFESLDDFLDAIAAAGFSGQIFRTR